MKHKDSENQLMVAQIGWDVLDSLGDKVIEESINGITADALSSIPGGTVVMGVYKGIRHYKEKQRFKNFVVFVKNYKSNTKKEISEYLSKNPTSELGDYTLSMIEELSSSRQTEMLGRATALLLNGVIDEDTFFEYGYIISKLDPHLFNVVVSLDNRCFIDERDQVDLMKKLELAADLKRGISITNPNQDLISFGFLNPVEINIGGARVNKLPQQQYTVNSKYKKFYNRIIIGEQCIQ